MGDGPRLRGRAAQGLRPQLRRAQGLRHGSQRGARQRALQPGRLQDRRRDAADQDAQLIRLLGELLAREPEAPFTRLFLFYDRAAENSVLPCVAEHWSEPVRTVLPHHLDGLGARRCRECAQVPLWVLGLAEGNRLAGAVGHIQLMQTKLVKLEKLIAALLDKRKVLRKTLEHWVAHLGHQHSPALRSWAPPTCLAYQAPCIPSSHNCTRPFENLKIKI